MINHNLTLAYKDVYGNDPDQKIDELFEGLDLNFASGLIEILNKNENNYNSTEKLIHFLARNWFCKENTTAFKKLENVIDSLNSRHTDTGVVIFNAPSSLSFLEYMLKYLEGNPKPKSRPTNAVMERNLLDAYLIINQEKSRVDHGIAEIKAQFPEEHLYWLFLLKPFYYADLVNRDLQELFFTEVAKAVLFFNYLGGNAQTNVILQKFLESYECETWEDYLRAISGMSVTALNTKNHEGNNFVHLDPELPFLNTCLKILDTIAIQMDAVELAEDHLYLRNHPVLRSEKDKFQVVYKRFFVEKIFRALYFELSRINSELGVMSNTKFRTQIYTSGYSENTLLYQVLDHIFENGQQRLHGDEMEKIDPSFGATDYVGFQHGCIYLFESKDILIRKEVKERLFIPELREEFRLKFYKDNGSDKGVLQLARNIKKMLSEEYEKFGLVFKKHRFIYPILVVHSDAFNIIGFNQVLQLWFHEACKEVGLTKKVLYKVKPVVLLDISTLVYYQDAINKKHTNLHELIDSYLSRTNINQNLKKKAWSAVRYESQYLVPFANYVQYQIRKYKTLRPPQYILSKVKTIFLNKYR